MHESVRREFERQATHPPARDERIGAFSRAVLQLVQHDAERPIMKQFSQENYPERTPSHIANIALRATQHYALHHDVSYPGSYSSESSWRLLMETIEANNDALEQMQQTIEHRNIQSNVTERYKAFKLVAQLLGPRIGEYPRIIDIGCSRNLGLKKLKTELPFLNATLDRSREESEGVSIEQEAQISALLQQSLPIGPSKGVDIEPHTEESRAWARSCSFYPSELCDDTKTSEYDYLDQTEIDGVEFSVANITDYESLRTDRGMYDIATASTFLYQLSPEEQAIARDNIRALLSFSGVIIYQDFVRAEGSELQFESNWFNEPYSYRTILEFAGDPEHTCHEVLRWENGRCQKWIPGRDFDVFTT